MNMHTGLPPSEAVVTYDILGIEAASLGWKEAIDLLCRLLAQRCFMRVGFLNAHNANLATDDPSFKAALADFLILPDGVGVDIAAKLLYGKIFAANLNGTDFIPAFLEALPGRARVGLIGARRESIDSATEALKRMAPGHEFIAVRDGFFTADEEPAILRQIEELNLDILLVAMGVPRQEKWVAHKIDSRHCTLPIAVGALFDFLSGTVPRAPMWMRRLRLEWLHRLSQEPRRLWRRYVIGNPLFILRVLRQKLSGVQR
ncbi:WecB/TagA/CpsF family glycosyltransferase [Mesorhizobium sp. ASY16-5R]|uniref:WecB/TagA/CpsF family glycosyltransferase n=1 Tax=Mesorhizobium sp. ASY16-5R TaxID=3445772 RepID=UPI003FA0697E